MSPPVFMSRNLVDLFFAKSLPEKQTRRDDEPQEDGVLSIRDGDQRLKSNTN
jgi:hypothetical protein